MKLDTDMCFTAEEHKQGICLQLSQENSLGLQIVNSLVSRLKSNICAGTSYTGCSRQLLLIQL